MDIKVLVRMGFSMMTPDAQEDRLNSIVQGNTIDAAAFAALINECRDACYAVTEMTTPNISEQQKIQIRWMLSRVDGKKEVRNMDPDELVAWVLDLRENKGKYSFSEKMSVFKALMKME